MKSFKIFIFILFINIIALLYSENEKGLKINKISGNEGKRWAICIGINNYNDDNIVKLKNAVNDALSLGKTLNDNGDFDKVITLVDDYEHYQDKSLPTKSNIEKKLEYILSFATPDDLIVFSFSGHGISDDKGEGYLITQDTDINKKFETSIKVSDVVKKFKEYKIKKTLLILDACREEISQTKSIGNKSMLAEQFKESEVAATFYSTKAGWFSYEDTESKYGVFTRFMLEGLKGSADTNNDGIVTFSELESYVQNSVNDYSLKNNRMQKPYTKIYGEKFGDLALTKDDANIATAKSLNINNSNKSIEGLLNFKASLKAGEEYKTALLSWAKNPSSNYDEVVILRSKKPIDINLENNNNYVEGEKVSNSDIAVYKVLKNDTFSFVDNTLDENSDYYYKIFTKNNNNGAPVYSKSGITYNVKTIANEETIQIRLDKLKVLQMTDKNITKGVELMWKIEVQTSTGHTYLLSDRPKKDYKSFVKGTEHNFNSFIEFKLPKKDTSYFDVVVDVTNLNAGIKVGAYLKSGPDVKVINNKHYRYNFKDEGIYNSQVIKEKEDSTAEYELRWTISKVK